MSALRQLVPQVESDAAASDPLSFYGRAAALVFVAIWGFRLAAMDYRDAEINGSFMHNIVLPIHEAGHVFFMPFGEFLTILGGSLFQVALPLAIDAAFPSSTRSACRSSASAWRSRRFTCNRWKWNRKA